MNNFFFYHCLWRFEI